jgi:predicted RecA/RadA family phage recombinase
VFDLTKAASQAWTVGAAIYWDNTAKVCTTVSAGNTKIGVAVAAVGNGVGETIGRVRLNGSF